MDRLVGNELVLEKVANKLPTRDILSIRRTSRIWNRAFIAALTGREVPVTLSPSATHVVTGNRDGSIKMLRDYTSLMQSSSAIPYVSYALKFQATKCAAGQLEELRDFLNVCGGQTRSIRRLEICFAGKQMDYWLNVDDILQAVIKKVSEIAVLRVWSSHDSKGPIFNFMELQIPAFKILQVLQTLQLGSRKYLPPDARISDRRKDLRLIVPMDDVSQIENVKNIGVLTTVRSISLTCATSNMLSTLIDAAMLPETPLRLSSFITVIRRCELEPGQPQPLHEPLHAFLSTQADALLRFELKATRVLSSHWSKNVNRMRTESPIIIRDSPLRIPNLHQLRQFSLTLVGSHYPIQFDYGSLQTAFPVLDSFKFTLEITRDSEVWQDNLFSIEYEPLAHVGVTNLALRLLQNDLLHHFQSWFPAVTALDIQLGERDLEHFPLLWTTWPGLQSLIVTLPSCFMKGEVWELDHLLTGIPKPGLKIARTDLEKITKSDPDFVITADMLREIQQRYKTSGGLSDLGLLQKFVLKMTASKSSSITLSDICGYLGFALASPNLQHIEVDKLPEKQYLGCPLTLPCLHAIRSAMSRPSYAVLSICGTHI